jgi:hypothetical protein
MTATLGVLAKWSYQEALEHINGTPHMAWMMEHTMTTPFLPTIWGIWNHFLPVMDHNTTLLYGYA